MQRQAGDGDAQLKGNSLPLGDIAPQCQPLHSHHPWGAKTTNALAQLPVVPDLTSGWRYHSPPLSRQVVAPAGMGSGGGGHLHKVLHGLQRVGVPISGVLQCMGSSKLCSLPAWAGNSLPEV